MKVSKKIADLVWKAIDSNKVAQRHHEEVGLLILPMNREGTDFEVEVIVRNTMSSSGRYIQPDLRLISCGAISDCLKELEEEVDLYINKNSDEENKMISHLESKGYLVKKK